MPRLDLPLEELYAYEGTNPRPADHDAYWQAALEEMRAVKPELSLQPAAMSFPNTECYDLYFTGVGGARVHAQFMRPTNAAGPLPAVLQFHGYSGSAGDWMGKLAFVHAGFAVAALDVRGQGGGSQDSVTICGNTLHGHIIRGLDDAPEKLAYRQIFLDTAQLAGIVADMEDIDETRLCAWGGSQGGALTVACAALEPRIGKVGVMSPFLSDYQRVWELDLVEHAYKELREYFRHFDPLHKRQQEVFTRLGYIDVHHLAPRVKAKALVCLTLQDDVCPPSTQFAVYNKLAGEKEARVYPDFAHETGPGFLDEMLQFFCES